LAVEPYDDDDDDDDYDYAQRLPLIKTAVIFLSLCASASIFPNLLKSGARVASQYSE
jgi:hypothetical protein